MKKLTRLMILPLVILISTLSISVLAQSDKELAEAQKKLNTEVLEKPFSVEEEAKVDEYIKAAMEKNLNPAVTQAPTHWQQGYTCADIYQYGWNEYQNCRYYRSYYGRYWY